MIYKDYLELVSGEISVGASNHIDENCKLIWPTIESNWDWTNRTSGLLIGQVQSGKTGNLIALIARLFDDGLRSVIYLTTDNIILFEQTLLRLRKSLPNTFVCGEHDEIDYFKKNLQCPTVLVLKKNSSVLKRWIKRLSLINNFKEQPLLLIDDEADAASLNTLVNKNRVSPTNESIKKILYQSCSSLYLQATATPFANLLLSNSSGIRPEFACALKPHPSYLGGEFFYGEDSNKWVVIPEEECDEVHNPSGGLSPHLRSAFLYFLSLAAGLYANKEKSCNFLVHTSVKIINHELVHSKLTRFLDGLKRDLQSGGTLAYDLIAVIPGLPGLRVEELNSFLSKIVIITVNSKGELPSLSQGFNVIVGGNSLGRGVTIPALNVCFYTRQAKTPQADTVYQHSRIFGYDRAKDFVKVFLPQSLLCNFRGITSSVDSLIGLSGTYKPGSNIKFYLPSSLKATRSNVVDKSTKMEIYGGTNYFIGDVGADSTVDLDALLTPFVDGGTVTTNFAIELLAKLQSDNPLVDSFAWAMSLLEQDGLDTVELYVRRNRSIGRLTGTLLSPDDRLLSKREPNKCVLFWYRVNGEKDKGWDGNPRWLPNLRLPSDVCFVGVDEIGC